MLTWDSSPAEIQSAQREVEIWVRGRRTTMTVSRWGGMPDRPPLTETVGSFAQQLRKTPEALMAQLKAAGVRKGSPASVLSEADKHQLLTYLKAQHGLAVGERKKITLTHKGGAAARRIQEDIHSAPDGLTVGAPRSCHKIIITNVYAQLLADQPLPEFLTQVLHAVLGRRPAWHEIEALRPYGPRLAAIRDAVLERNDEALVCAVRQCFGGVRPTFVGLLEAIVLKLIASRFSSVTSAGILIAWESLTIRGKRRDLKVRSFRATNIAAALAAWRRRRNKRQYPACVATLMLG